MDLHQRNGITQNTPGDVSIGDGRLRIRIHHRRLPDIGRFNDHFIIGDDADQINIQHLPSSISSMSPDFTMFGRIRFTTSFGDST